jgi:hypothetical protein
MSSQNVRTYLSLAWVFFTIALGSSTIAQAVLALKRPTVRHIFWSSADGPCPTLSTQEEEWYNLIWIMFHLISLFLQILVLLAFFFLALVVVAYVELVGWAAVGFTVLIIIGTIVVWIIHTCC